MRLSFFFGFSSLMPISPRPVAMQMIYILKLFGFKQVFFASFTLSTLAFLFLHSPLKITKFFIGKLIGVRVLPDCFLCPWSM